MTETEHALSPVNRPKICCIGHITLDKIVTPSREVYMPGGTAWYFAHALSGLNHSGFRLVAGLAETEMKSVAELKKIGIDTLVVPSRRSVYFENIYGEDLNNRRQKVLAKADPFTTVSLKELEADTFHLGTLLADDFPEETIKYLASKGEVSADVQGFLRNVVGEEVHPTDWKAKKELLPYIHTLKANEHEMYDLTGETYARRAAAVLESWGVKESVLTLGDRGSLIYAGGKYYDIPAYPVSETVDATGCGDTYMAGYLLKRSEGASPLEAGKYAAAMCSLKLAHTGPFLGSDDEVRRLIV